MTPANYQFVNSVGVGPIDGPAGIEQHSKDLAFRLYTTNVPEPASCLLMAIGLAGVFSTRRRLAKCLSAIGLEPAGGSELPPAGF